MAITPREIDREARRCELDLWQRRDVTIDFVCAVLIMCGGAFIAACLI